MAESVKSGSRFTCAACGKQYAWKPQLAGKKAKCSCGAAVVVLARDPGGAATPERSAKPQAAKPAANPLDDESYDFAEPAPQYGTPVPVPVPVAAQVSTAAPKSMASGKFFVRSVEDTPPDAKESRRRGDGIISPTRDYYLPAGLLAAGFLGILVWAFTAAEAGAGGLVLVAVGTGLVTLIKTGIVIGLALVVAPMFGVSFGEFKTAILKFAAILVFTDMALLWLDEIVEAVAGTSQGRGARKTELLVTLLFATTLVAILTRFLFDMDAEETGMVALPLVIASLVIGFVLKVILVVVLAAAAATDDTSGAAQAAAGGGVATTSPATQASASDAAASDAPAAPAYTPVKIVDTPSDKEIGQRLRTPAVREARAWHETRTRRDAVRYRLTEAFYGAGAERVYFDLIPSPSKPGKMYVRLSDVPEARKACFEVYAAHAKEKGTDVAPVDSKERYLVIHLRD